MKKFLKRLKNAWCDSTIFGKFCLVLFFPLWLLCGLNENWD